jgi:hypothetical protein
LPKVPNNLKAAANAVGGRKSIAALHSQGRSAPLSARFFWRAFPVSKIFMEENMRALIAHTMSRSVPAAIIGAWVAVGAPAPARANVITDWDEKAVAVVTPMSVYHAQRVMGVVHAAMFDAVNSIERRYRPYLVQLPADPATSKDAAAAAAAAAVLGTIDPKTAGEMKVALASYLVVDPRWRSEIGWRQARRGSCCKGLGGAGERRLRCAG